MPLCRSWSAVPTSAYGLTMVVKVMVLTPAIYAGWVNFRGHPTGVTATGLAGHPDAGQQGERRKAGLR